MGNAIVAVLLLLVAVGVATAFSRWRRRSAPEASRSSGSPARPGRDRPSLPERWRLRSARWLRRPGEPRRPVVAEEVTLICITCQGRGWIDRRERTLTFTGTGFADVENPPTMCETCAGSGRVTR
ncbi:hypothetical protein [Micromonospora sagamiensis]|uniref:Uncharacterized protein n=1 Tax=Micromonospora sagamiensis TaxID=47875 RepID=A0A562WJV5_9ACTN|nr:hypothetical protein [Micromonospora sagamiensis]TWJ30486.1 hypothetical protein JD81_04028 [Micromonospora sagamiensis]BCL16483.1 hypothetical protein GCM10017556_42220 [Micromonospora sagamiensis]